MPFVSSQDNKGHPSTKSFGLARRRQRRCDCDATNCVQTGFNKKGHPTKRNTQI